MFKIFLIGITIGLVLSGCGAGGGGSSENNVTKFVSKFKYIPQEINDSIAIRFLNKATFGATSNSIKELKEKGVERWLDEQLNMSYDNNIYLKKMILMAKQTEPDRYPNSLNEYLADNDIVFNKKVASFYSSRYRLSSWFDVALTSKKQLRYKTAYALSQIIVESDFEPVFKRRAEALARYFDILAENSFSNYQKLLEDISFNSGMGVFLTYNGNKKVYLNDANVSVYPDENYARELMQLFSIGLNKLNLDGTPKKDKNGNLIPTYTQTDVNEISRVFTGWDLKRSWSDYWSHPKDIYGLIDSKTGDFTHSLEFTSKYHDFGEKHILGEKIEAGLSGEEDIKKVISIIMKQPSVAPYISKNLIMRLTKSNPSPAYVKRVAEIFQNTNGNLKEVIRAIFTDEEFWNDLKNSKLEKFKEPLIAYTQFLRTFNAKPLEFWYFCKDSAKTDCIKIKNTYLFNDTREYLNQGAGLAPTVFNFYDNSYIPNDTYFKNNNFVAPELQIQTDSMLISFSNKFYDIMYVWEKNYMLEKSYRLADGTKKYYKTIHDILEDAPNMDWRKSYFMYIGRDKFILNMDKEYELVEKIVDGDSNGDFENLKDYRETNESILDNKIAKALINHLNNKLNTTSLSDQEKDLIIKQIVKNGIYNKYSSYSKKAQIFRNLILPMVRIIVTSENYMTE